MLQREEICKQSHSPNTIRSFSLYILITLTVTHPPAFSLSAFILTCKSNHPKTHIIKRKNVYSPFQKFAMFLPQIRFKLFNLTTFTPGILNRVSKYRMSRVACISETTYLIL